MHPELENYIVMLLGVVDKPIPTMWHLQKEMFVLSRVHLKIQEFFNFEKHYEGPYSQTLHRLVEAPLRLENVYSLTPAGITLTREGKNHFDSLRHAYEDNEKFKQLLSAMKLTRTMYDRLSKDELLFLIYTTYPDYIELSNIYDKLVKDRFRRKHLALVLLNNGFITEKRYEELASDDFITKE